MNFKKLLLMITMLMPAIQSQSWATALATSTEDRQEDGDTNSLIAATSRELQQAYEVLEALKRRTRSFEQTDEETTMQTLPRNLDNIRDQMIRRQLIDVLSATPYSDPRKHIADCKAAIQALENYVHSLAELTDSSEKSAQAAPLSYVPRSLLPVLPSMKPANEPKVQKADEVEVENLYDLAPAQPVTPEPKITPITPLPAVVTPIVPVAPAAVPAPLSATPAAPTPIAAALAPVVPTPVTPIVAPPETPAHTAPVTPTPVVAAPAPTAPVNPVLPMPTAPQPTAPAIIPAK